MKPRFALLITIILAACGGLPPADRPTLPATKFPHAAAAARDETTAIRPRIAPTRGVDQQDTGSIAPMPVTDAGIRLGVILPLSGRSNGLGERLAEAAGVFFGDREDAPSTPPELLIRDGDSGDVAAVINELAAEGVFAAVGLFDRKNTAHAASAATLAGLPLIMLTAADLPESEGPPRVWRALHSYRLAAATAAAAGLHRGGRAAAILRPESAYGDTLARHFRSAWASGGGEVVVDLSWPIDAPPDYGSLARKLRGEAFDTLFIPDGPGGVAPLVSHLAAAGVWSRTKEPRFEDPKFGREVWLLGTPEWYSPTLLRQAGRYLEGAMVPVVYAAETPNGRFFAEQVRELLGREASLFDAVLADSLHAAAEAARQSAAHEQAPADALSAIVYKGVTAGLRFDQQNAVGQMYVLEVRDGGFAPISE